MYKTSEEYAEPLRLAKEAFRLAFPEIFDGMKKGEAIMTLTSMMPYIQPYATHISIQQEQQSRWEQGPRVVTEIPGPAGETQENVSDQEMIKVLEENMDLFNENTQKFLKSCIEGCKKYGHFTENQLPHVIKHYNKAIEGD